MNRYQTLGKRLLALIVDTVVLIPLIGMYVWLASAELSPSAHAAFIVGGSILNLSYNIVFHWKFGQTLGKMVAKVKVVDVVNEVPISFKQAFLRDIVYVVLEGLEFIFLGAVLFGGVQSLLEPLAVIDTYSMFAMYAWLAADILVCIKSEKNRALHDFIAGTVVVDLTIPSEIALEKNLDPPAPDAYESLRASTD